MILLAGAKLCFSQAPNQQLLILSDVHFNPFADQGLVTELAAAPPERWEQILDRSKPENFSGYHHDTNWWLLQSALDATRATEPHPALVIVAGDLLAHQFPQTYQTTTHDVDRAHYRAFVRKTVVFLAAELHKRFKETRILITPGNNDDECGDYDIKADGPFLSDTARLVSKLAGAGGPLKADWRALGSYSFQPPSIPGLRILSVNTVFFSNKYQAASFAHACAPVTSDAGERTFSWLEKKLAEAKQAKQKVWLMFHIPPGIDGYASMTQMEHVPAAQCGKAIVPMWKPMWTERFSGVVQQYQSTISAIFAGHTHTDDFRLIGTAAFVLIDPPISPIYGQNPAFRVVSFDSSSGVTGHSVYYLTNLEAARGDVPGKWEREYSFAEEWQTPSWRSLGSQGQAPDVKTMQSIYDRIRDDPQARAQWLTLLNTSSTHDPTPASGVRRLFCAIADLDPAAYEACACSTPAP
jgi:sphingomyelin phosphodiesterase acid-like 3